MIEPVSDSAMRNSLLASELPIAWCRLDANGTIVKLNEVFSSLLQLEEKALVGVKFEDVCAESKSIQSEMFRQFKNFGPISFRTWIRRGYDGKFPAIVHAMVVAETIANPVINVIVLDDSFNYVAREKARLETESSRQKEQLKNEFIAIASHELRTPIQPILGFALLAKRGKIPQEQAWDGVLKEARRLQQLANDILDVSRIEANQITYKMENVRINDLIQNILDSAKTDIKKDIILKMAAERVDQEIVADKSRITQVISNLVNNSIKFTQKGSVSVSTKLLPEHGLLEIRVSDTGPGIPGEMLPRLFTKFATKDHGDATLNVGTGLGLYICKSIISAHKGSIEARNLPSGGAEFITTLPLEQD